MEGNSTTLQTIEVNPAAGQASASVIWMHGLGAEGNDFLGIIDQLGLPADHTVRFIFPDAPSIPKTINVGMIIRGLFDLYYF